MHDPGRDRSCWTGDGIGFATSQDDHAAQGVVRRRHRARRQRRRRRGQGRDRPATSVAGTIDQVAAVGFDDLLAVGGVTNRQATTGGTREEFTQVSAERHRRGDGQPDARTSTASSMPGPPPPTTSRRARPPSRRRVNSERRSRRSIRPRSSAWSRTTFQLVGQRDRHRRRGRHEPGRPDRRGPDLGQHPGRPRPPGRLGQLDPRRRPGRRRPRRLPGHGQGGRHPRPRPGRAPRRDQGQAGRRGAAAPRALRDGDDRHLAGLRVVDPDASTCGST